MTDIITKEFVVEERKMERAISKNPWKFAAIILIIGVLFLGFFMIKAKFFSGDVGANAAGQAIVDLAKSQGAELTINNVKLEGSLYAVNYSYNNNSGVTYVTRDGNYMVDPMGMVPLKEETIISDTVDAPSDTSQPSADVVKSDKPKVELFVMSHCPYGTQAEKGILPVANLLGNKIDFSIKFVYYLMHGEKEKNEELLQTCLINEQATKYNSYLNCFLESEDSSGCLTTAGIDKTKLNTCINATDKKYNVTTKFNDKSTWLSGYYPLFDVFLVDNNKYSIGGSPTLIINGVESSAGRSPASYLSAVCAAFNTAPSECSTQLSSSEPSPGFGSGTAGTSGTTASCG